MVFRFVEGDETSASKRSYRSGEMVKTVLRMPMSYDVLNGALDAESTDSIGITRILFVSL